MEQHKKKKTQLDKTKKKKHKKFKKAKRKQKNQMPTLLFKQLRRKKRRIISKIEMK